MPLARPRIARPGAALLLGAGLLASAGCGDVDGGSEPFAGTSRFQDSTGAYEMRLLEPPWVPITINGVTFFAVPPTQVLSINIKETDLLYDLHVTGVGGDAESAFAAAAAAASPPWNTAGKRPVKALSGAQGVELAFQQAPKVFRREVFLGTASGPTFLMDFTSKNPMDDDKMITAMILSFAPRGTIVAGAR